MKTMRNKYTIWVYYLKPCYVDKYWEDYSGENYDKIYAYTTKRSLKIQFEREREMCFFYKKKFIVNRKELNDIYRIAKNRELSIDNELGTSKLGVNPRPCITNYEYMQCKNNALYAVHNYLWGSISDVSPWVLEQRYIDLLSYFYYIGGYMMMHATKYKDNDWDYIGHIQADIFSVFINEYGWSLKKEFNL